MPIETIAYAKSNNELRGLTPVLDEWTALVERYSENHANDACYWYNERASLSVLAAAAWKTKDWVALEEYSTVKRTATRDSDTGRVVRHRGRCDLYLASPNGSSQFAIEAKQAWQPIGSRVKAPFSKVKIKAAAAWDDAGKLNRHEASHRLAATFCVPSIPTGVLESHLRQGGSMEKIIDEWIKGLHDNVNYDAIAYVFPRKSRELEADWGRVYPGVALILKRRLKAVKAAHK